MQNDSLIKIGLFIFGFLSGMCICVFSCLSVSAGIMLMIANDSESVQPVVTFPSNTTPMPNSTFWPVDMPLEVPQVVPENVSYSTLTRNLKSTVWTVTLKNFDRVAYDQYKQQLTDSGWEVSEQTSAGSLVIDATFPETPGLSLELSSQFGISSLVVSQSLQPSY